MEGRQRECVHWRAGRCWGRDCCWHPGTSTTHTLQHTHYNTQTTPVTSLVTTLVVHTHRHVQAHTRRVAVALTYSCHITSVYLDFTSTLFTSYNQGNGVRGRWWIGPWQGRDLGSWWRGGFHREACWWREGQSGCWRRKRRHASGEHVISRHAMLWLDSLPLPTLMHALQHCCWDVSHYFSYITTLVMHQARVLLMLQEKLPECTNKQRCDEFCTSFCYLNSKGARKKLVQALIKLPRSRLDLTSTYSRCSPHLLIVLEYLQCSQLVWKTKSLN